MKCFNCGAEVTDDDSRTVSQYFVLCRPCYRHMRTLIDLGYYDQPTLETEVMAEAEISTHFNVYA